MIIASSFDFQGNEKEISPWMPNVAKLLRLQVFVNVLKDFKMQQYGLEKFS